MTKKKRKVLAELTPKQQAFCEEYVRCRNGAEAARLAGYAPESARRTAHDLLHKEPIVRQYIRILEDELREKAQISRERIVSELEDISFSSVGDVLDIKDGFVSVKNTDDWKDTAKASVSRVRLGKDGMAAEIIMHDKIRALDLLSKICGYQDKDSGGSDDDDETGVVELAAVLPQEDVSDGEP